MIPLFAVIGFRTSRQRTFRLWLPLFLVWLLLLPLVLVLFPFFLVGCLILDMNAFSAIAAGWNVVAGLARHARGNKRPEELHLAPHGLRRKLRKKAWKKLRRTYMTENRRQILEMLAAGKITADEAERLMSALVWRRQQRSSRTTARRSHR